MLARPSVMLCMLFDHSEDCLMLFFYAPRLWILALILAATTVPKERVLRPSNSSTKPNLGPANLTSHPAFSGNIWSLVLGYVGMELVRSEIMVSIAERSLICLHTIGNALHLSCQPIISLHTEFLTSLSAMSAARWIGAEDPYSASSYSTPNLRCRYVHDHLP